MSRPPRVFISYRVDDVLPVAGTLARELESALSWGTVFIDYRSLEPGDPWRLRTTPSGPTAGTLAGPRLTPLSSHPTLVL